MRDRSTVGIGLALGLVLSVVSGLSPIAHSTAADWPTWRHDAERTAVIDEELPATLELQWTVKLPAQRPAWPEDPRIGFDVCHEPIVAGGLMFVASATTDSVTALDAATGAERWKFYADGPVRLAPVAHQGTLYFGADDGCLYCVEAANGALRWKLNTAPGDRLVLGNERMISNWPVRGGPVVTGDKLYFTSGVWPFEGTLLYSVDLRADAPRDAQGVPPYTNTTLPNLSPQGYVVGTAGRLYIPCGRSKTGVMDVSTGAFSDLNYDSKGRTDVHVTVAGHWLLHGDRVVDVARNLSTNLTAVRPVATAEQIYFPERDKLVAHDLANLTEKEVKDRRGNASLRLESPRLWEVDLAAVTPRPETSEGDILRKWDQENPLLVDLRAGNRVHGHRADTVFAVALPSGDAGATPTLVWQAKAPGRVATQLAANGRLYVVTEDGTICCYGATAGAAIAQAQAAPPAPVEDKWTQVAADLLSRSGVREGYCLALGVGSGRLVEEIIRQSKLRVIAIETDAAKIAAARTLADRHGWFGDRLAVVPGDLATLALPAYFASLVVSEAEPVIAAENAEAFVGRLFHVLRPYGGVACLRGAASGELIAGAAKSARLSVAEVTRDGDWTKLARVGALPGSAEWTHEYGDAANTLMSPEQLVKAPLGVLWYGGPSARGELYFDRHDWGPSMVVVDGRIFFQGPGKFSAVDVYTGRVLWSQDIKLGKGLGRAGNFAVAGYHLVGASDALYLAYDDTCLVFDPATGEQKQHFSLSEPGDRWGRMRVWEDVLLVEVFGKHPKYGDMPVKIAALDRHTGRPLWSQTAGFAFPFFAVGDGKVFCFDGILQDLYRDMRRKGNVPKAASERSVVAFDAADGHELWRQPTEMIVTWLSYSAAQDVLVVSNKSMVAAHQGQTGKQLWQREQEGLGFGGHPESVWDKVIVYKDRIIDQRGPGLSYYLETGQPLTERHPLTGEAVNWEFTKSGHHCNYAIASEHLLTFRAADAGFFDMVGNGTGRLSGFRSGCRNSLLPACGVLNAPNFAHGCVCGYSLFTSLSFVHVPEVEMWTYSALPKIEGRVRQVGLNLGAPGDRRDNNGTLWLDFPSIGGASPDLPVTTEPERPRYFRHHAQQMTGEGLRWVAASGAEGLRKLSIRVAPENSGKQTYTVRLHFAEPENVAPGARVFDVALQGKTVRPNLDVRAVAGESLKTFALEVPGVEIESLLDVTLEPRQGETILCGVEVLAEKQ